MIKKILYPIDGSEYSKKAFEKVIEMANNFDSEVIVLHTYDLSSESTGLLNRYGNSYPYFKELEEKMHENGQNLLNIEKEKLSENNIKVETLILKGDAGKEIVQVATENNCDLIVMGSKGKSSLKSVLIGSVSDFVIHNVKCPVLLVH